MLTSVVVVVVVGFVVVELVLVAECRVRSVECGVPVDKWTAGLAGLVVGFKGRGLTR